jgi:anion-transporting  ArsA/GET3 family ATPase
VSELLDTIAHAEVIVCCGPGGVGKTTVSATVAIKAAGLGRRVCVLTVDPARRLADALGISGVGNTPVAVPGILHGSLSALMLDTEGTFNELIDRYAADAEQAESIKTNRLYGNLASALSGTQEYMAMEKLYELITSGDFDLVVVDTPPTRNALDLLDAPRRLTAFLQNRVFRALLTPTRAYLRAVSVATRALVSTIGSVAGAELLNDVLTFFQAFAGMEEGFSARAGAVHDRLRDPTTAFILVTSPRRDSIEEARFFADRLAEAGLGTAGVVVNRVHPIFSTEEVPSAFIDAPGALGSLARNLLWFETMNERERAALDGLASAVAPSPLISIALSTDDVHDLSGLERLGQFLDPLEDLEGRAGPATQSR